MFLLYVSLILFLELIGYDVLPAVRQGPRKTRLNSTRTFEASAVTCADILLVKVCHVAMPTGEELYHTHRRKALQNYLTRNRKV